MNWPAIIPPAIVAAITIVTGIVTVSNVAAQLRANNEAQAERLVRVEKSVDRIGDTLGSYLERLTRVETLQGQQGRIR